jgi:1,4-dihydroxy-2-naphthoate octaprenyltransferase
MPVLLGTGLAWGQAQDGRARPGLGLLAVLGMLLLHAGANLLSDVCDLRRGVDRVPTPASGALVRGWLSQKQTLTGAVVALAGGVAIGLVLAWIVGWKVLVLGVVGVAVGVFYTLPPIALKYRALGDAAVFLDFGLLGALGGWLVQTGSLAWRPVVWSVPLALLVVAIVHANNWRDRQSDREAGISTVAGILTLEADRWYYGFLIQAPFVLVLLFVLVPRLLPLGQALPWTFLLSLAALPRAWALWRRTARVNGGTDRGALARLDGETAGLNLQFGVLCLVALFLERLF